MILITLACMGLAQVATQNERTALQKEVKKRGRLLALTLAGSAAPSLLALNDSNWSDSWSNLHILLKRTSEDEGVEVASLAVEASLINKNWELFEQFFSTVPSCKESLEQAVRIAPKGLVVALVSPEQEESQREEVCKPVARLTGAGAKLRNAVVIDEANGVVMEPSGLVAAPMVYGTDKVEVGEARVKLDLGEVVDKVVSESWWDLVWAAGMVVLLGVVAGLVFVAFLVEPLRRLRAGVERLAGGDLGARVPPSSRDEVGEVTRAFNAMGDALQQKERIQKEFGRYVSDYVLEQLLSQSEGDELRGAEREVTILFADLRRFTRLSEGMKAKQVVALLNEFFQLASDCILAGGGTIDKFIGDSVMAYFGAPVPQSDHAERAVAVAIEIQRAVAERNAGCNDPDKPLVAMEVGVGIHTGMVVVGNIGSQRRTDFTAIGDVVNVAHRLEKLARRGQILVSEAVQRDVRGACRLRFEGERQLSGRKEPVHVYAVEPSPASTAATEPV